MLNINNRKKIIQDFKHRAIINKIDIYFQCYVINNLMKSLKYNIEKKILFFVYLLYIKNNNIKKIHYNNYGFLSGRSKFIITKYGISRIEFKKLMLHNNIPGITKSSW